MNNPRERENIFRNRIAEALRWADRQSDADIERELDEIDATQLSEDEVAGILEKTDALRADFEARQAVTARQGRRVTDLRSADESRRKDRMSEVSHTASPRTYSTGNGDTEMKKTATVSRSVSVRTRPAGSSSALALVASCASLMALVGLFHVSGVDKPTGPTANTGSATSPLDNALARTEPLFVSPTPLRPQRREATTFERVQVGDIIRTGERQRRRLMLPDGSVLFVNQQTVARVETPRRLRLESGEVFVEVVPQALLAGAMRQKFVVTTPDGAVTALGTKFAVRAFDDKQPAVLVTQGEVAVAGVDGSLEAGQELVDESRAADNSVAGDGGFVVRQAPRTSHALSWTRDLIAAAELPLIPFNRHAGGSLIVVDSEGQEMRLSLRNFHVDVFIQDGFARTTIDQTYFNHTQSRQEGTFHFPLPPDASLSRLAMYVNGKLMEGGMAERDHARNTFEEIVRSMKDPALLEWVDGSTFKMRVFPLEPRQEKRIVMSYTQRLSNDYGREVYRFPAGHNLDRVRDWSTRIHVAGGAKLEWDSPSHFLKDSQAGGDLVLEGQAQRVTLDKDLVVELVTPEQRRTSRSVRLASAEHEGQQYLMLRYRPELKGQPARPKRNWVFLFESSGDRDPILARVQVDVIRTFLENAEHDDTFAIVRASSKAESFSVEPVPCVKKQRTRAVDFMEDSHLLGALDLQQALQECGKLTSGDAENWLVHVGSGIPAIGQRDATALERLIPKTARYVGVGVGKRWNRMLMRSAAGRTGGHFTQVNPDEKVAWRAFELFSTLNAPRLLDVKVASADDGELRFLNFADTLAHGQELCSVTRLPAGEQLPKSLIVTGLLNGEEFRQKVRVRNVATNADYLPRSWTRLEIDRLVALGAADYKAEIISLSKAMYVMSPFTSLLVLENEAMYKQYNIDRGREDHWALYGAPPQIKVVHEPLMGPHLNASADEIREQLRQARAEFDQAQADVDLARREQRDAGIINDLIGQLEFRDAKVEALSGRVKQLEKTESDELAKLAGSVAWRTPQPGGQQVVVWGGYAPATTWADSGGWHYRPQHHWGRHPGRSQYARRLALLHLVDGRRSGIELSDGLTGNDWLANYELSYGINNLPVFSAGVTEFDAAGIAPIFGDVQLPGANQPWGVIVDDSSSNVHILSDGDLSVVQDPWAVEKFMFNQARLPALARPELRGTLALQGLPAQQDVLFSRIVPQDGYFYEGYAGLQAGSGPAFGNRFDVRFGVVDRYNLWGRWRGNGGFGGGGFGGGGSIASRPGRNSKVDEFIVDPNLGRGGQGRMRLLGDVGFYGDDLGWLGFRTPDSMSAIRGEVDGRTAVDSGTLLIRGNHSNVDGVMRIIQEFERFESSPDRPETIHLDLPEQDDQLAVIRLRSDPRQIEWQLQQILAGTVDLSISSVPVLPDGEMIEAVPSFEYIDPRLPGSRLTPDYLPYVMLPPPGILPDLFTLMPGLQTLPADKLAVLEAEGGQNVKVRRGSVDRKARRLIERARKSGWQKVVLESLSENNEPVVVSVCGDGRFRYDRKLPYGIRETVVCDGESLWHIYAELGLAAKRPMSRFHRAAMDQHFPWLVASADDLSVGFDVRLVDENTIELIPLKPKKGPARDAANPGPDDKAEPGKARRRTLITQFVFGDDGRLIEKRLVARKKRTPVLRTVFKSDGTVRVLDGDDQELMSWTIDRSDSESVNITPKADQLVVLPLPYRSVDHVQPLLAGDSAFTTMSEDDAMKVVSAWFAAGNFGPLANLINQRYIQRNDNRLGFLTLVSVWTPHSTAVQPIFQSRKDDPLASFLVNYYDWRNFRNANVEFTLSDRLPKFVQNLVRAHNLFALWHSGRATKDRTRAQIEREVRRSIRTIREVPQPGIRWQLLEIVHQQVSEAGQIEGVLGLTLANEIRRFEELPEWRDRARHRDLVWLLQARETKGTGAMFRRLLVDAADSGAPIVLAADIHELFRQRLKGHRDWTSAVKAVAKILHKNRGPASLINLAEQCRTLEEEELAREFFADALTDVKIEDDRRLLLPAYNYVRRAGDWQTAEQYLRLILADESLAKHPATWREASAVSAGLGDDNESLRRLEHALNIEFQDLPESIDLKPFRTAYGELFDRFAQLVEIHVAVGQDLPDDFIDRMLSMADRWRTVDPDDSDVCRRVARMATRLGRTDLALGYVTTPLAENPGESQVWRELAGEMGSQSMTDLASRAYDQAFAIESTNPEILFEHATMLREAGRGRESARLLRRIVDNTWQRRFNGTIANAKQAMQQAAP